MRIGRLILLALALTSYLQAQTQAFILADVANVRESANAKSKLVARFPMNAKVSIISVDGEWKKVAAKNIEGWVHQSILSERALSGSELVDSIKASNSKERKKKWADRLNNGFPYNKEFYPVLLNTYREIEDSAGLNQIEARMNNKEDIFIARARFGQIQLLGKINGNGAFESLVKSLCPDMEDYEQEDGPVSEEEIRKAEGELQQAGTALTGRKWYSVKGQVDPALFARFTISPEDTSSSKALDVNTPKDLWFHPSISRWVSFGDSKQEEFFATAPIQHVSAVKNQSNLSDSGEAKKSICEKECNILDSYTGDIDTSFLQTRPIGVFNYHEVQAACRMCDKTESWHDVFIGIVNGNSKRVYPDVAAPLAFKNPKPLFNNCIVFKIIGRPHVMSTYLYRTENVDYNGYYEDFLVINPDKLQGSNIIAYFQGLY